jgi:hypothetical protein
MTVDPTNLLTIAEAAQLCHVTPDAIRARIHRRQLTPIKFGARRTFVERDELLGLLRRGAVR